MAKQKFSEAEIIAALKRSEAGLTYEQLGRELGFLNTQSRPGKQSTAG